VLFYDEEKIGAIKPYPHVAETLSVFRKQREGSYSTSQQLFSNSSTIVEEIKADATIADCEKNLKNTYLGTYNQVLFNKLDLTILPVPADSCLHM